MTPIPKQLRNAHGKEPRRKARGRQAVQLDGTPVRFRVREGNRVFRFPDPSAGPPDILDPRADAVSALGTKGASPHRTQIKAAPSPIVAVDIHAGRDILTVAQPATPWAALFERRNLCELQKRIVKRPSRRPKDYGSRRPQTVRFALGYGSCSKTSLCPPNENYRAMPLLSARPMRGSDWTTVTPGRFRPGLFLCALLTFTPGAI